MSVLLFAALINNLNNRSNDCRERAESANDEPTEIRHSAALLFSSTKHFIIFHANCFGPKLAVSVPFHWAHNVILVINS